MSDVRKDRPAAPGAASRRLRRDRADRRLRRHRRARRPRLRPGGRRHAASPACCPPAGCTPPAAASSPTTARPCRFGRSNWFGLETANCAPHGLWSVSMGSVLDQVRGFGFNALRMPFANQCLESGAAANSIDYAKNPDLVGKKPLAVLDALISEAGKRGLKVILDRHRPDTGSQSELWYTSRYSEARWICGLADARPPLRQQRHRHRRRPPQRAAWRGLLGMRRPLPRLGGGRHAGRERDPGGEPEVAHPRRGRRAISGRQHELVGRKPARRRRSSGDADRAGPTRLLAARLPADRLPADLVLRPELPGEPARASGTATGASCSRTGRAPVLLGEFGTKFTDASDKPGSARWSPTCTTPAPATPTGPTTPTAATPAVW